VLLTEWWILSDGTEIGDPGEVSRAALHAPESRCLARHDEEDSRWCCCEQGRRQPESRPPPSVINTSSSYWHSTGKILWHASKGCESEDRATYCKVQALRCFLLASRLLIRTHAQHTHVWQDACVAEVLLCNKGRRAGSNRSWIDTAVAKALRAANLSLERGGALVDMPGAVPAAGWHTAVLNAASALAISQRPRQALFALRLFLARDCGEDESPGACELVRGRRFEVFRRLWFGGQLTTLGLETHKVEHALLLALLEHDHAAGATFLSPWEALMAPLPRRLTDQGL
jgi:hypothetical protein